MCAILPPPPTDAAGFKGRQGAKSGSTGYGVGVAPTLVSGMTVDTVYCLQGNGIDRADTAGCNGCGWRTDQSYTLNTIDRPAVAIDCRNHTAVYELSCPLQAKNASSLNFINPVCVQNTGRGWWNEGDTGATLRTPSGGGGDGAVNANLVVYDARGNGDGDKSPTITGDHNGHVSDYTAVCVEEI